MKFLGWPCLEVFVLLVPLLRASEFSRLKASNHRASGTKYGPRSQNRRVDRRIQKTSRKYKLVVQSALDNLEFQQHTAALFAAQIVRIDSTLKDEVRMSKRLKRTKSKKWLTKRLLNNQTKKWKFLAQNAPNRSESRVIIQVQSGALLANMSSKQRVDCIVHRG